MANGLPPGPGVPTQQLPSWLGSAVQITTQVGVPTVFAGVLLWFVLTSVGGTLQQIEQREQERTAAMVAMEQHLVGALDEQTTKIEAALEKDVDASQEIVRTLQQRPPAPQ